MSAHATRPNEINIVLPPWPARPSARGYAAWLNQALTTARDAADWYICRPLVPRPIEVRPEDSRTRERKIALYLRLLAAGYSGRSAMAQAHIGDQTVRTLLNTNRTFRTARADARRSAYEALLCPYHSEGFEVSRRYETPLLTCPSCSKEAAQFQLRLRHAWDEHFGTRTEVEAIRILNAKPVHPLPDPARRFHRRGSHR